MENLIGRRCEITVSDRKIEGRIVRIVPPPHPSYVLAVYVQTANNQIIRRNRGQFTLLPETN